MNQVEWRLWYCCSTRLIIIFIQLPDAYAALITSHDWNINTSYYFQVQQYFIFFTFCFSATAVFRSFHFLCCNFFYPVHSVRQWELGAAAVFEAWYRHYIWFLTCSLNLILVMQDLPSPAFIRMGICFCSVVWYFGVRVILADSLRVFLLISTCSPGSFSTTWHLIWRLICIRLILLTWTILFFYSDLVLFCSIVWSPVSVSFVGVFCFLPCCTFFSGRQEFPSVFTLCLAR